jgi:hypothetical protein
MNFKALRAGERRKLARNLRENVTARQIGVLGAICLRAVAPILLLVGCAVLAQEFYHHAAITTVAFGMAAAAPATRDFLEVMDEGEKLAPSMHQRSKFIEHFDEKLAGFIDLVSNKAGMPSHRRQYLMKEAEGTTDFPVLFGTVLERTLKAKYTIAKPDWRTYIKTGLQNDFRKANIIGVWGLESAMDVVAEAGEYKAGKLSDGKVENVLRKYGKKFPLTWEALMNDDLGAFSDVADRLNNAALRTEFLQATKLIAGSLGPNTALYGTALTHPIDGATVANKGTGALTETNLETAVTTLRSMKDADGDPIMIEGFELVVPPKLEITAKKILSPGSLIGFGGSGATVQTSTNVIAEFNIRQHVNVYLPIIDTTHGDTAWYLFATLASGAAVQLNFLRGHESPEIVQKLSNKMAMGGGIVSAMEGDFENDIMEWRARHILGGTQVDPRYTYASDGTAS